MERYHETRLCVLIFINFESWGKARILYNQKKKFFLIVADIHPRHGIKSKPIKHTTRNTLSISISVSAFYSSRHSPYSPRLSRTTSSLELSHRTSSPP